MFSASSLPTRTTVAVVIAPTRALNHPSLVAHPPTHTHPLRTIPSPLDPARADLGEEVLGVRVCAGFERRGGQDTDDRAVWYLGDGRCGVAVTMALRGAVIARYISIMWAFHAGMSIFV